MGNGNKTINYILKKFKKLKKLKLAITRNENFERSEKLKITFLEKLEESGIQ